MSSLKRVFVASHVHLKVGWQWSGMGPGAAPGPRVKPGLGRFLGMMLLDQSASWVSPDALTGLSVPLKLWVLGQPCKSFDCLGWDQNCPPWEWRAARCFFNSRSSSAESLPANQATLNCFLSNRPPVEGYVFVLTSRLLIKVLPVLPKPQC